MHTCPHCGYVLSPKAKAVKTLHTVAPPNTATMTTAELYAHYKRTAPAEDLKFWLQHAGLSPELRAGFEALKAATEQLTISRPAFYRQLTALQNQWRRDSNDRSYDMRRSIKQRAFTAI